MTNKRTIITRRMVRINSAQVLNAAKSSIKLLRHSDRKEDKKLATLYQDLIIEYEKFKRYQVAILKLNNAL